MGSGNLSAGIRYPLNSKERNDRRIMKYSFGGRIRYSEIGENGCLTLPGLLDYFQDCCTFQSEFLGQGMGVLKKRERAWVLSAWQVIIRRYPAMGEEVVTTTWPYEFRGFMGMRNFTMETASGERVAWANSFWTNLNTAAGFPARLREEDLAGYGTDEKLDMEYAPRKIALPEGLSEEPSFPVQKHHLDTNHHVNNCQYVRMAEDFLPEGAAVRQLRAEYKRQARLRDVICPRVRREEDKVTVVLGDEKGEPYTVVEFEIGGF